MARRPYTQRLRAESAAETRERILDALYDRLREAPAEPISVDEVARRARVARSTVYLVFGSRSGLFDALTDRLLAGAGYDQIQEAVRRPDARETLRGGLAGGADMYAAHHDVFRVLNAMAKLDPGGVGQALARSEAKRADGMGWLAGRLADQGGPAPGDHAGARRRRHLAARELRGVRLPRLGAGPVAARGRGRPRRDRGRTLLAD